MGRFVLAAVALAASSTAAAPAVRPLNVVVILADDLGWSDTTLHGTTTFLQTPAIARLAARGMTFTRAYSASPLCSPSRAALLTGLSPARTGITSPKCHQPEVLLAAAPGTKAPATQRSIQPQTATRLPTERRTIAEALRAAGYATGHFGKWHLSGGKPGAGRPLPADEPLGPGKFGFDHWFTVSNWFDLDWTFSRKGEPVKVAGDGSDAIVAEALEFIGREAKAGKPVLAVVWFGSPHVPLKPRPEDRAAAGGSDYYGELVGVDRAMGTLRQGLRDMGIAADTLLWYTSDNGAWEDENAEPDAYGSNGSLRGHKGLLWEGGIRVPGLIEWPARIKRPVRTDVVGCTIDIYPTVVEILGLDVPDQVRPLDGVSLLPLIDGTMRERPRPIGFWHHGGDSLEGGPVVWMENRFKLFRPRPGDWRLYDLVADRNETTDVAAAHPQDVARMKAALEAWQASVRGSERGGDYAKRP